jgi:hypothetical protein
MAIDGVGIDDRIYLTDTACDLTLQFTVTHPHISVQSHALTAVA